MLGRRTVVRIVGIILVMACPVIACTACTTPASSPPSAPAAGSGRAVITVGSFDFPESALLAYLYAGALSANGYRARVLPDLGSRELVDPALMTGLIDLVPEYAGSALEFVSDDRVHATASVATTSRVLASWMKRRGLITAHPAAAQDNNAIVVTSVTAARYRLRAISDLARVAPGLVFGGPPECPERPYCLEGLQQTYRLRFQAFAALDAGGPLTRQALVLGEIGVALLFTTDPAIQARHLVVLADNRSLQPAENVVPVLRRVTADTYGARLLAALNAVSARLSTAVLTELDAQMQLNGRAPGAVADGWLKEQGLAP
jgi:osmoprotectant transport system substrate-binding protein